jgi:S1-C subfamily serine protease
MGRSNADGSFVGVFVIIAILIAFALLHGCARTVVRERVTSSTVYVDEAELIRDGLAKALRATALVKVETIKGSGNGIGSAVLVVGAGPPSVYLTAAHVIESDEPGDYLSEVLVQRPGGEPLLAMVRFEDRLHDLALLETWERADVDAVRLAPAPPRIMDRVWTMGAPNGIVGQVGAGRWGVLRHSDLGRDIRNVTGGFLWPGMSGGPTVDDRGRLVGVNDTVYGSGEDNTIVPQIGGVVDWRDVRDFLEREGVR